MGIRNLLDRDEQILWEGADSWYIKRPRVSYIIAALITFFVLYAILAVFSLLTGVYSMLIPGIASAAVYYLVMKKQISIKNKQINRYFATNKRLFFSPIGKDYTTLALEDLKKYEVVNYFETAFFKFYSKKNESQPSFEFKVKRISNDVDALLDVLNKSANFRQEPIKKPIRFIRE